MFATFLLHSDASSVLSYDPQRLQFVADLLAPVQDAGSVYILSSRFHRFFLKNVDTQDINTRVLRLGGVLEAPAPQFNHGNGLSVSYADGYSIEQPNLFPTSPAAPLLYKNEITHGAYSARPLMPLKTSVVENFFNSIRQPYQYEPVGLINKNIKSPFTSLNMGERPDILAKAAPQYIKTSQSFGALHPPILANTPAYSILNNANYLTKLNPTYNDFNSLRRTKSISYNETAVPTAV